MARRIEADDLINGVFESAFWSLALRFFENFFFTKSRIGADAIRAASANGVVCVP